MRVRHQTNDSMNDNIGCSKTSLKNSIILPLENIFCAIHKPSSHGHEHGGNNKSIDLILSFYLAFTTYIFTIQTFMNKIKTFFRIFYFTFNTFSFYYLLHHSSSQTNQSSRSLPSFMRILAGKEINSLPQARLTTPLNSHAIRISILSLPRYFFG